MKKKTKEIRNGLVGLGVCIRSFLNFILIIFKNIFDLFQHKQKHGYSHEDAIKCLNSLTPRGFEIFCGELFKQLGYRNVTITQASHDYGRDIIMRDENGETIFVECKYYKDKAISREICQKILGSMQMFNVKKGMIITTSHFGKNALEVQQMVGKDKLELIDKQIIVNTLNKMKSDELGRIIMKSSNIA